MCSQAILCDFLKEYENNPDIETYIYKDKKTIVETILQNYAVEVNSGKKADFFEKIQRYMPFDNYEFLHLSKLKA